MTFGATFCGSSNLENLPLSNFEKNIGLEQRIEYKWPVCFFLLDLKISLNCAHICMLVFKTNFRAIFLSILAIMVKNEQLHL